MPMYKGLTTCQRLSEVDRGCQRLSECNTLEKVVRGKNYEACRTDDEWSGGGYERSKWSILERIGALVGQ